MTRRTLLMIVVAVAAALALEAPAMALRIPVDHVDGTILDADQDRILYRTDSGLAILDRTTRGVTSIPLPAGTTVDQGFLSPHGALFDAASGDVTTTRMDEFRDGSLIDHGQLNSPASIVVAGLWAIWSNATTLYREDLGSATVVTVTTNAGNWRNDVDRNGTVYYWASPSPNYQIFRFDGTSTTQLTHDDNNSVWNTYPITDGVNVVYRKTTPCCFNDQGRVAFYGSGGETVLDSFRNDWPERVWDYDAAGGWIAFTRLGATNELQIWERSPAGAETRISPTGANFRIVAMSPNGDVIYTGRYPTNAPDFYLGRPGASRQDLGTTDGQYFWDQGDWYLSTRRTLYRIDPNPDPYPRPRGATPVLAPFVIAYKPCTSPSSTHGAPLSFGSCTPPQTESDYLTVGTPDSNGKPPRSEGSLRVTSITGNASTWADEANVKLDFSYTDVFNKDLTDYTGELRPQLVIRRTDRNNLRLGSGAVDDVDATDPNRVVVTTTADHGLMDGDTVLITGNPVLDACYSPPDAESPVTVTGPRSFLLENAAPYNCTGTASGGSWSQTGTPDPVPATGLNFAFAFSVPCAATTDTQVGSDCVASTSADAIAPGMVREGDRSIWQIASARVYDGGADGDADTTADNTLFATEGVFVP
jgi:hypothetical protein